jgi:transcriptional regulator with XRE-family HTH domain
VDDIRAGRILRALRRRLRLTQKELGRRAGVSQQVVSLIERGHGSKLSTATLRRVFAAVDARWEPTITWRGGQLDRLLDEEHARIVGEVVRRLKSQGWEVAVEVTYSEWGERGSLDVLAGRHGAGAVLGIEVKSELTAVDATVRKLDEKDRLVRRVLCRRQFGFRPRAVGRLLALPSTDTARRRVRTNDSVLAVAFPARGTAVREWIRRPDGDLSGLLFIGNRPSRGASRPAGRSRVRSRSLAS